MIFSLNCGKKAHSVKYTDSAGNRVSLHVEEQGEGIPVLFLHGNTFSSEVWKKQFEAESLKKFRLIAYDLRGHGKSVKFGDAKNAHRQYSLSRHAEDLRQVISALKLEKPVVVGWSLGGNIVLRYLADNPEPKVARAMIFGAAPSFGLAGEKGFPVGSPTPEMGYTLKNVLFNPELNQEQAETFVRMALGRDPADNAVGTPLTPDEVKEFAEICRNSDGFSRLGLLHGFGDIMKDLADGKLDTPPTDESVRNVWQGEMIADVKKFKTPLKVLLNKNDMIDYRQMEYMAKINPEFVGTTTVYENGHGMFFSSPDEFNKELVDFIEK